MQEKAQSVLAAQMPICLARSVRVREQLVDGTWLCRLKFGGANAQFQLWGAWRTRQIDADSIREQLGTREVCLDREYGELIGRHTPDDIGPAKRRSECARGADEPAITRRGVAILGCSGSTILERCNHQEHRRTAPLRNANLLLGKRNERRAAIYARHDIGKIMCCLFGPMI